MFVVSWRSCRSFLDGGLARKTDLENSIIKTRLAAIDTIQSSLRNHGILPLVKVEELMQDLFFFFPLGFSQLHKNRGGTSL